jgi:hypothetical protein
MWGAEKSRRVERMAGTTKTFRLVKPSIMPAAGWSRSGSSPCPWPGRCRFIATASRRPRAGPSTPRPGSSRSPRPLPPASRSPRTSTSPTAPPAPAKPHVALGLGLSVGFTTAAALVHELLEACDERRLLRLQRQLEAYKLLIIDKLGYVPLSTTGAELLFEIFSRRYERGSVIVTSNLPFDEWTSVFGAERLTGALLDRLTHHVHILEMNGESYRLQAWRKRQGRQG